MSRNIILAPDEWYHCYNRGVDKRKIFMEHNDYRRFQMVLYAANSVRPIHISSVEQNSIQGPTLNSVLEQERDERLVDIGAYALMPNHYHLLLRERIPGGVTSFMRKLGTGYTMFFNIKYERTGALFSGKFKAKHVATDAYIGRVVNYIHANPAELYESRWKEGVVKNESRLQKLLLAYPFSSLIDYVHPSRPESALIELESVLDVLEERPSFKTLLTDALIYAKDGSF
jgi:putative transposase